MPQEVDMSGFNLKVINESSSNSLLRLFVPFVHSSVSLSSLSPPAPPRMSMVSIHDVNDLCSLPLNKVRYLNRKTLNFAALALPSSFLLPAVAHSRTVFLFHLLPSTRSPSPLHLPSHGACRRTAASSHVFPVLLKADACPPEGPRPWPCV